MNALTRIANYLPTEKKNLIINSIVKSQFSYCPLIWMFCPRSSNNSINHIHERGMKVVHNNLSQLTFQELLQVTDENTIHQNNLKYLAIEMYKYIHGLSPPIRNEVFTLRENKFNLRNFKIFYCNNKHLVKYGTETVSYRGPQIWNSLSSEIKESPSILIFKTLIKSFNFKCPCRLYKTYITNLGFI